MAEISLSAHQTDLRRAYLGGGLGAFVSGCVWLVAAVTTWQADVATGYVTLFFGGFLIFPLSAVIEKLFFKRPGLKSGNPGGALVMETLPAMIAVLLIGFLLLDMRPEWVFPLAAIAVGAHYFPFRTAYGDRTYWVLGGLMMGVGFASLATGHPDALGVALAIAVIEIGFGIWLTIRNRRI
ncbi:DUF7010 family protein [Algimonas porphyrae]|uniref:Uncharacterized protein n=1 Tax=Algimonas porphyrae TaxID=1128113 RepID=A0ABQ5V224_9PROT|nr:hypothetical protein [Algimonas porphyrae]GLQ21132.1 hypothetical protein GCM10007854_20870 [Algimonas porphyrae]